MTLSEEELRRQQEEINWFAAMALAGVGGIEPTDAAIRLTDDHDDTMGPVRVHPPPPPPPQQALSGAETPSATGDTVGCGGAEVTVDMAALDPTGSLVFPSQRQRRQHLSKPAHVHLPAYPSPLTPNPLRKAAASASTTSEADEKDEAEDLIQTPKRRSRRSVEQFASLANVVQDTGSFALAGNHSTTEAPDSKAAAYQNAAKANLEKALAALASEPSTQGGGASSSLQGAADAMAMVHPLLLQQHSSLSLHHHHHHHYQHQHHNSSASQGDGRGSPRRYTEASLEEQVPMFAEEVFFQRPLFFGAAIPPRVLREGRIMFRQAMLNLDAADDHGNSSSHHNKSNSNNNNNTNAVSSKTTSFSSSPSNPPRLSQLPASLRNLVGALRTYGFGLDILRSDFDWDESSTSNYSNSNDPLDTWRGDPYVSCFEPVWCEEVRMERAKEYLALRRPHIVTRSLTAPARLFSTSSLPLRVTSSGINGQLTYSNSTTNTTNSSYGSLFFHNSISNLSSEGSAGGGGGGNKSSFYSSSSGPLSSSVFGTMSSTTTAPPTTASFALTDDKTTSPCASDDVCGGNLALDKLARGGRSNRLLVDSNATATTSATTTPGGSESGGQQHYHPLDSRNAENQQFSLWIRGDDDAASYGGMSSASLSSVRSIESLTSPRRDSSDADTASVVAQPQPQTKPALTDQEIFSQWARGSNVDMHSSSTIVVDSNSESSFNPSTFQRMPPALHSNDSDDDSVNYDERKKQVGVSDHLSKAIASLAAGQTTETSDSDDELQQIVLSQVPPNGSLARPLTNYELTNGCAPLFGVDDAPLPVESDLGIHETKEDQQRAAEQKRSQEIIEKLVPPNVFGTIACPNPATSPDDYHSWNSRSIPVHRSVSGGTINSDSMSVPSLSKRINEDFPRPNSSGRNSGGGTGSGQQVPPLPHQQQQQHSTSKPNRKEEANLKKKYGSRARYGWWNVKNDDSNEKKSPGDPAEPTKGVECNTESKSETSSSSANPLHLPPQHHSSSGLLVRSLLEPSPEKLRDSNLPLSRMHAATSMAQSLPYLSDRPPSHRFLQIDTQAIGFPPLEGEVEPLFCSLAVYNVESVSNHVGPEQGTSVPIPDLQRCGRVTEALCFDVVNDRDIARRCAGALWPYASKQALSVCKNKNGPIGPLDPQERLVGTRCGVYPLPSNLSLANLYAVLIVRKVLSEEADLEPYIKKGKNIIDIDKLRSNAEKSSSRHGQFLMPFAFGVAPLVQVFGTDNPMIASSRAVQIPLFRFTGEERQIIDHIMVMLYPRADHKANGIGGPAQMTNGPGSAMLVMRNFGYLGLHAVVDNKSTLARERLVDFTGELQVRRRKESDPTLGRKRKAEDSAFQVVAKDWHPNFIAEPSPNGGRMVSELQRVEDKPSDSYAQELAPVPLQLVPPSRIPGAPVQPALHRGRLHANDSEPFYHTAFCNELLCHPRLLHNCPKGNIVIKIEFREMEWNEELNGYFAHLPRNGACIHNQRRGPYLVQSAFTSCSPQRSDHHFIDEFKIKLPLDLKPINDATRPRRLAIVFTVYCVKLSAKSTWKRAKSFFSVAEMAEAEELDPSGKSRLAQIACGFLPITSQLSLLDNGMHDVRVMYRARKPSTEMCEQGIVEASALVLVDRNDDSDLASKKYLTREDSFAEETTVSNDNHSVYSDRVAGTTETISVGQSSTSYNEFASEEKPTRGQKKPIEPISLSVKIMVHSSVHSQNETLAEFLNEEPDLPLISNVPGKEFMQLLRSPRDLLLSTSEVYNPSPSMKAGEDKLLASILSIANQQICAAPNVSTHILRIMPVLWRILVCGTGEADLVWSNPAASTPLRVHAFGTVLNILGASALYLSKSGVMQVDGVTKWSVVNLGRVMALLFDERKLFGAQAMEKFDDSYWEAACSASSASNSPNNKKSPKKKSHQRQLYDLSQEIQRESASSDYLGKAAGSLTGPTAPVSGQSGSQESEPNYGKEEKLEKDMHGHGKETFALKRDVKVDSKSEFQSRIRAASSTDDDGIRTNGPTISTRPIGPAISRRYGTLPANLGTITELDEGTITEMDESPIEIPELKESENSRMIPSNLDSVVAGLIDDMVPTTSSNERKQFRRPQRPNKGGTLNLVELIPSIPEKYEEEPMKVATSDEEIERSGTAFLEKLRNSLGISTKSPDNTGEGGRSVGGSHHRKTCSRSSIDWTLLSDERPVLKTIEPITEPTGSRERNNEYDEKMTAIRKEESTCVKLPSFVDRLSLLGKLGSTGFRWFPYAYEVVIMQWSAILVEQQRRSVDTCENTSLVDETLKQAASRTLGVAVASAPMLFGVIKQSLGFRVHCLFKMTLSKHDGRNAPPLVLLDETMLVRLEQIITMVIDACLDSRNFDSWELRQVSIDVNDSIIRFLRDMFSFLAPSCVHRLLLSYFSRFVAKDGRHWQDRDSTIGLRCSWEITKLRLNAITALIRFPDFIKINSPQMLNWWMSSASLSLSDQVFDEILDRYSRLGLPDFIGGEGMVRKLDVALPALRPHWLAEIAVDICLLGTEHAEQYIQHRSAALLHELFWAISQESILSGIVPPVAAMFVTFIEKTVSQVSYFANFSPKSQLRRDIVPCALFVLQGAPSNLLRALWRRLCSRLKGKGLEKKYGLQEESYGFQNHDYSTMDHARMQTESTDERNEPDILDMFSFLNIALRTVEYDGCDEHLEAESPGDGKDGLECWRREFLLSRYQGTRLDNATQRKGEKEHRELTYTSSAARKWQAHDASLVIIDTGHDVVREMYSLLRMSNNGKALLNPAVLSNHYGFRHASRDPGVELPVFDVSHSDVVLFVRAATSLYLHALALRESDLVIVRTFKVTAEVIKIFGIKIFLESVGETLQHWMRVISLHCGGRRAQVRIEATDLLELVLRSTWECYGSFFRIRVPLLAVQTEVMERIVATAAARYYRDQRRLGAVLEMFSNVSAEASLVPLWRTLDRIETMPASQNVAFRGALIRMAGKLKKLYRAYVAARVLSFIQSDQARSIPDNDSYSTDFETQALIRANRINVLRVINASEGHSKQFLGFQATRQSSSRVAHFEAVEDALIDAADVFSPTELPEHRVAWLRMLADFHASRKKFAEEAMCHFHIYVTLNQASKLHGSLWSNTPFLPWTDNIPDPVYIDGYSRAGDPDIQSEHEFDRNDLQYGGQMDSANSFRRIFYRVANSVGMVNEDWETGVTKNLFYGITYPFEYHTVSPWITLRKMEEDMVEESEAAGELFLSAGIVESSRFAWSLATQYYAEKFNYTKLAIAYGNLTRAVVSRFPPIDPSLPQEVSATLGRYYRVWFHGGAPDELSGVEFVYRAEFSVNLDKFGENLREVIKSIIPDKTPIHLVLDGRVEEQMEDPSVQYGFKIGPAPLEPVRIKVTPLRPLFANAVKSRGLPEWFYHYADQAFSAHSHRNTSDMPRRGAGQFARVLSSDNSDSFDPHNGRSLSATLFSSTGSAMGNASAGRRGSPLSLDGGRGASVPWEGELSGVNKFCFVQRRDRSRGSKDWWKMPKGDFATKSLRVTELNVNESFPACVARQAVSHRHVFLQSPLEAGVDAICQWCAVVFRTAVATVGISFLGTSSEPGIGTDAAKVVAECIHSSHVKEIGIALLKKNSDLVEGVVEGEDYDRLSDDEVNKLQLKLARLLVVFIELLHLLIARNRDILLDMIQDSKKGETFVPMAPMVPALPFDRRTTFSTTSSNHSRSMVPLPAVGRHKRSATDGTPPPPPSDPIVNRSHSSVHGRSNSEDHHSQHSNLSSGGLQPHSAIAVQSELQRSFIGLAKALHPRIHAIMMNETPRWLKQCALDSYFSTGTYRHTEIRIADDICLPVSESRPPSADRMANGRVATSEVGYESSRGSAGGGSVTSLISRGSER